MEEFAMVIEELRKADALHAAALEGLRVRADNADRTLSRHDIHIMKLDETIASIREQMSRAATKDDVMQLRKDISDTFNEQLRAANASIPAKFATSISAAMFVLAAITLALNVFKLH